MTDARRRIILLVSFAAIFSLGYRFAAAQGRPGRVRALLTEEGQHVVFDRITWQMRELTKRLPLDQPWPAGPELQAALTRYGLQDAAPEKAIPVPAEIERDVYLVGQDHVSNLTYMIDCGEEGVAIIDPTYASEFERTIDNVEKCGFPRAKIRWVLNTHCHVDHAQADSKFRTLGAQILVPEYDADAVEKGTRVTAYYLVPGETSFPKSKVDRRLSDGEELQLGNKLLHVIHNPGHTPGSASFRAASGRQEFAFLGRHGALRQSPRMAGESVRGQPALFEFAAETGGVQLSGAAFSVGCSATGARGDRDGQSLYGRRKRKGHRCIRPGFGPRDTRCPLLYCCLPEAHVRAASGCSY